MLTDRRHEYVAECADCGRVFVFDTTDQRAEWISRHPSDHEIEFYRRARRQR